MPIRGTMGTGSKEWMDWVIEEDEGTELLKAIEASRHLENRREADC